MLYQQVRPQSFDEVLGNKAVIESLRLLVSKDPSMRPHALLFSGDSGCGKTTIARITAREFGCEPIDIIEMNAANTRGIDTVRDVVNSCSLAPMAGKAKAYIFDESHQMTGAAQEALLKVIEDTPPFTYFFFCTTNPEGLIKTIRNRCATYEVQRLRPPEMMELLILISDAIEYPITESIIQAITKHADGCSREALVTLEKIAGMEEAQALDCISTLQVSEKTTYDLCRLIIEKRENRWIKAMEILKGLETKDSEGIRKQILGYLRNCLYNSKDKDEAARFASMIDVLNVNTYYGGDSVLAALIFTVCML